MILGRVVGRAVSSRKDEKLLGTKLLLIEEVHPDGRGTGDLAVVADHLGAGQGDVVLVSQGSAARFTGPTRDLPLDAVVVGMVDAVRMNGHDTYIRARGFEPTG
jgi:microcompartment protein CcmK/EutM